MPDLAILGGTVVSPQSEARLNIYVDDGRVAAVTSDVVAADNVVDATGLHVFPGFVDTHVHLMDPGPTEREDFPTGTAAAAARGVTTIVEHTHGHPIRLPDDLTKKREHLRERSHVDYGLAAHVWPDTIDRLHELWEAGVTFFKIFTCTTHGVPGIDTANLWRTFTALADFGGTCLVHCEDEAMTAAAERFLRAEGRTDNAVIAQWRSREAEEVAAAVTALLARHAGAQVNVAHVSTPAVAALVAREREAGADIAAEGCPQYFLLREDELLEHGALRKFTPPARARSDAEEDDMWRLLRHGVLNHISTDHAPSTLEQKRHGSIWDVHFGLPGLDTTAPLLLDAATRGKLSLGDVVRVYAERPAKRYGLFPRKGHLGVGADADIVLADLAATGVVRDQDVLSKAGWTPYAGRSVNGRIVSTFLRGRPLAADGAPVTDEAGRFLPGRGAAA
ncbi:MAG: amidohydrolase family protein [Nitriliruptorales bacterium]|nr:amidohydrolase family protein [Nitriliruptorales bacterium]